MNQQIPAWPIGAHAASIIQNLKPITCQPGVYKMRTNIEPFSDLSKLVALTHLYVELRLPLLAARRATEADLRAADRCGAIHAQAASVRSVS
jgi:hypothetical protein